MLAPAVDLTDEAIAEMDEMVGVDLTIEQFCHEASFDTIRHYARAIGDENPLYLDPDYGASTRHGGMIAPPTFPYAVFSTIVMPKLLGIQGVYGRAQWTYTRPIRRGDVIRASARVTGWEEKRGRRAGRFIIQVGESLYEDAAGELVARCITDTVRVPRSGAREGLHHEPRARYEYTEEELKQIERDVFAEEVRGTTPRYGEDVVIGDRLQPVVKGPYEREDLLVFYSGALPDHYHTCERRWQMRHGTAINNLDPRRYRLPNSGYGHQDPSAAANVGMPNAYDNGCQRVSWFGHLMSNWMGDDGFLAALDVRVREPNIYGDTLWLRGTVSSKERAEKDWLVTVVVSARNQMNIVTADGTATVRLPARIA